MNATRLCLVGMGAAAALGLSACAGQAVKSAPAQTLDAAPLTQLPNGGMMIYDSSSGMASAGPVAPIAPVAPVTDAPLPDSGAPSVSQDGSVEVYSLDNTALGAPPMPLTAPGPGGGFQADMSPPPPVMGMNKTPAGGTFYGGNQDVEVFPLDGPAPASGLKNDMPFNMAGNSGGGSWVEAAKAADRLYFKNGSAVFAADDAVIARVAGAAGTHAHVRIDGHASRRTTLKDRREAHIVNLSIAMRRAENVANALIRHGVPARNIQTTAWGDTRPPSDTDGRDAEAAARRVEIYLQQP